MLRTLAVVALLAGCDRFLQLTEIDQPPKPDAPPPPSSWASGEGGWYHTCGIREDQTLWCWGRNYYGQLGVPSATLGESDQPLQVGTDTWLAVSADENHTCGIKADHTLSCWGNNGGGALGTGDFSGTAGPVSIPGTHWVSVATGDTFGCALDDAGAITCWGNNARNELGTTPPSVPSTPIQRTDGPYQSISAGGQQACALDMNGAIHCWGNNGYGQAAGDTDPAQVSLLRGSDTYTKVSVGYEFACGLTTTGHLRCWGRNSLGQLGDDTTTNAGTNVPTPVDGDSAGWIDVDTGDRHACGLKSDGTLWCWGDDAYDALAIEVTGQPFRALPTQVMGGNAPWIGLALGASHTCAIAGANHQMWCAGRAGGGQLGTVGTHSTPAQVPGTWSVVATGHKITCAIDMAMKLSCWGDNGVGNVGDGTTLDRQAPTAIGGSMTWSGVAVGDHVCALDHTNVAYCWGENDVLECGDGTTVDHFTPQMTTFGTAQLATISSSKDSTCALFGTVPYCWGENYWGNCGTGNNPQGPINLPGNFFAIAAGDDQTCALATGGGVMCWGSDDQGNLGDGMNTSRQGPGSVIGLPSGMFQVIASGGGQSCAIQGTRMWCWGYGLDGEIGNQSTTSTSTPYELVGPAWKTVTAGDIHTCAIDTSGKLYCWGSNDYAQLGDGTFHAHHEPTLVGSDSDWASVAAGERHTCALKTDNTLWCWGDNTVGELGTNDGWRPDLQVVP